MSEIDKLSPNFTIEVLKACLVSEKFLTLCSKHLKYQYLETEEEKEVYKFKQQTHIVTKQAPTVGIIAQSFATNQKVINLLAEMKKANVADSIPLLTRHLESYIKDVKFLHLYDRIGDLYNDGKKEEAISLMSKESKEIHEFNLNRIEYATVFGDFYRRQEDRESRQDDKINKVSNRIPWGIRELQAITKGIRRGTLGCYMAKSGGGKSTAMRWTGLSAAREGMRVVHFSQEGTEEQVMEGYDAAWTSIDLESISFGIIPENKKAEIAKAWKAVTKDRGEIYVFAVESFNALTLLDCRQILWDVVEDSGPIDLIIWDYLELFQPGGKFQVTSEGLERKRREDVGNGMVNLAIEFNAAGLTATQANDVPFDKWNNPEWCMKRNEISEFKGMVKPLAYFITINQTIDEREEKIARLYIDKLRFEPGEGSVLYFCQSLSNGRFYDNGRTLEVFGGK